MASPIGILAKQLLRQQERKWELAEIHRDFLGFQWSVA
jgi:hypothetical protein